MASGINARVLAVATGVPLVLLSALLIWGTMASGGSSGRPGVNPVFGEVPVSVEEGADFELTTIDGQTVRLSSLRGQVVMVDFWSSWCPPCIAEGPDLAEAYRDWRGHGVEFVGIAVWDTEGPVRTFIENMGIEYPNIIDSRGGVVIDFGVRGLPEKFFLDHEGRVVRKFVGPVQREKLDEVLSELVAAAASAAG